MNSFPNSNNGKAARVHECVICSAVFSSGQALGGHMRQHRQTSLPEPVEAKEETKNEKKNIVMSLDLNLPASKDDNSLSGGYELTRGPSKHL
ncbi:Zinc finger protein ZAT5 [Dendrobium catenatum]|uniref:Zinc finger protein ZAT5 n=1 Tax=Dendrobium catenatum TaxID=906689 RepID=A0A2I0VEX6_9ASPA|nr:Zinc finger protein ZAT5 [Dendrobium catenatum]